MRTGRYTEPDAHLWVDSGTMGIYQWDEVKKMADEENLTVIQDFIDERDNDEEYSDGDILNTPSPYRKNSYSFAVVKLPAGAYKVRALLSENGRTDTLLLCDGHHTLGDVYDVESIGRPFKLSKPTWFLVCDPCYILGDEQYDDIFLKKMIPDEGDMLNSAYFDEFEGYVTGTKWGDGTYPCEWRKGGVAVYFDDPDDDY